jgi:hypothetical protein
VDWDAVGPQIEERTSPSGRHEAWTDAARAWLVLLCASLGRAYRLDESDSFLLLSAQPQRAASALLGSLERSRTLLLDSLLPGIADGAGPGKHVAICFGAREPYTSYIAHYYPEVGHFSATGGLSVWARPGGAGWGYSHFVAQGPDLRAMECVVVHELTHDLVSHLQLPAWIDEGLATTAEGYLMHDPAFVVLPEDLAEQRAQWRDGGIQEFWSGAAFHRPDDSNRLAYQLARLATKALSRDYGRFRDFVLAASRDDAGDASARQHYGGGLGGLIEQFLGPGDWTPAPDAWDGHADASEA